MVIKVNTVIKATGLVKSSGRAGREEIWSLGHTSVWRGCQGGSRRTRRPRREWHLGSQLLLRGEEAEGLGLIMGFGNEKVIGVLDRDLFRCNGGYRRENMG